MPRLRAPLEDPVVLAENRDLIATIEVARPSWIELLAMLSVTVSILQAVQVSLRARAALQLEIVALRHQVHVLQRSRRSRVWLPQADRVLWVWLSRVWSEWRSAVVIVRPETVIAWHPGPATSRLPS